MICVYCNNEFCNADGLIEVLDGDCPSSCDDKLRVEVRCPQCERLVIKKLIDADYLTWSAKELPDNVKIIPTSCSTETAVSAEFEFDDGGLYIVIDGETLFVRPTSIVE